jgi:flagellar hook protein FlgE
MGLASALSTALTGLTAAETTIDVVGNNLANSNTVGFKASQAAFATQFLQTRSLGSGPTGGSGGTNPRQIGLGTMVADITPNFSQGTIEISSSPTDLAIQGDGFFIVQGKTGAQLYTRNGVFKMNAQSELTTSTGNRLLGFGVDKQFQIQTTGLVPLTIPLGAKSVAKATQNVFLEGTLTPTGELADKAANIQTGVLSDAQWTYPGAPISAEVAVQAAAALTTQVFPPPQVPPVPAGHVAAGDYHYKIVYADSPYGSPAGNDTEGKASDPTAVVHVGADDSTVQLSGWTPNAKYAYVRFYRSNVNPPDPSTATYSYVGEAAMSDAQAYDTAATGGGQLDTAGIGTTAQYQYYVSFYNTLANRESRPVLMEVPASVDAADRLRLYNLPALPAEYAGQYNQTRIYRNLASDNTAFRRIATINSVDGTARYTDKWTDAQLLDPAHAADHPLVNLEGPNISASTLLKDVRRREGSSYLPVFDFSDSATLQFTGSKGGRTLATKEMTIYATADPAQGINPTTVLDLTNFMQAAMGIQAPPGPDSDHPIPKDDNSGRNPGAYVTDGRVLFVGNNGVDNAVGVGLSGMKLVTSAGQTNVNLPFTESKQAIGESAVTDFIAYDSLGIPVSVRLTAVLESRTNTATTYRWFADSPDNQPTSGVNIAVGTGLLTFDREGNFSTSYGNTIQVYREHVTAVSPLTCKLDFSQISGLAAATSSLAVSRQDGSAPGVLTSFIVGEDGRIRGVFSNGITRDLGQIRLARFSNPAGLEQQGENMFAAGVNSGLPIEGDPNQQGIGSIIAGAQELSNTDIGGNLIDLILASTMYRGNTRVITTVQQMLDELLALRR